MSQAGARGPGSPPNPAPAAPRGSPPRSQGQAPRRVRRPGCRKRRLLLRPRLSSPTRCRPGSAAARGQGHGGAPQQGRRRLGRRPRLRRRPHRRQPHAGGDTPACVLASAAADERWTNARGIAGDGRDGARRHRRGRGASTGPCATCRRASTISNAALGDAHCTAGCVRGIAQARRGARDIAEALRRAAAGTSADACSRDGVYPPRPTRGMSPYRRAPPLLPTLRRLLRRARR